MAARTVAFPGLSYEFNISASISVDTKDRNGVLKQAVHAVAVPAFRYLQAARHLNDYALTNDAELDVPMLTSGISSLIVFVHTGVATLTVTTDGVADQSLTVSEFAFIGTKAAPLTAVSIKRKAGIETSLTLLAGFN